jgi:putative nucleotidyltransferase with HDIG domain
MTRRILLVDQNAAAAAALAEVLTTASWEWEVDTVRSGLDALTRLGTASFDVVITTLRLSGMGGAALLGTVAVEHPDVVRIAHPGNEPVDARLRAATCAHQFIASDFTPADVVTMLTRTFSLRDTLASPELRAIVGRLASVPTLPALYTAVTTELNRRHASGLRVGELVADDPAMASKLLQMVNSPFFGLQMRVSDPVHAVQLLGLDTVRALVLSTHVFETFRKPARGLLDVERLWRHATAVSSIAGLLAHGEGLSDLDVQDARTAGLLHDIGKLLLVATLPVVAMRIRDQARRGGQPLVEIEHAELGVTHAELGAYLLGLWGLPLPIVEAAAWHHAHRAGTPQGLSPLALVVAGNLLEGVAEPRSGRIDLATRTARLHDALQPFGLADRAGLWVDWTLASLRSAA